MIHHLANRLVAFFFVRVSLVDEKQGPAVAFKMLMDVMEYHVPKLARTEHTGKDGGPVLNEIVIKVVDADRG